MAGNNSVSSYLLNFSLFYSIEHSKANDREYLTPDDQNIEMVKGSRTRKCLLVTMKMLYLVKVFSTVVW